MTDLAAVAQEIERLKDAFSTYGYYVDAYPIEGMEEVFVSSLRKALANIEKHLAFNAKAYGYRGRSKNAIHCLHKDLPQPGFGVNLYRPIRR